VTVEELRLQVRGFLAQQLAAGEFVPMCDAWLSGYSAPFSARLGERGWIGVTWPRRYGGQELSQLHRFVIIEELLVAGAPVAAHWIADRQSGPSILRYGTEAQKQRFLPEIAAGRHFFAIGMSEPDSGSDLASVRTTATRIEGGWRINGRKLWTSQGHRSQHMIALCRSSVEPDRHAGLSQFIIDLAAPGVTINPIQLIDGGADFNEIVLDDVVLGDDALLGEEGDGWSQVTQELVFERGGPERFLSVFQLVRAAIARAADTSANRQLLGQTVADLWALQQLSKSIVTGSGSDRPAALDAAITKDLGTRLEQQLIERAARLVDSEADPGSALEFERLLAQAQLHSPGFTIRGGTVEILRGVIAKLSGVR
jgi:alkylation response protein AidB-like acyl-CoA dehydrogenase